MAAFEVPIATGLFTGIPHDIATAPGAMLPGQAIGNLPDAYWAGQNQAYQQRLRDLFKNGVPGNLGDIATQLAQVKGADAIPEYIALRNRQAADIEAARPLPDVGTGPYSGYTPGPQTNAPSAEPAPSPTAGTATARQIAQAREVPLAQFMAQNRITDPDIPLTYDQRKALVYGTSETEASGQPVRVAGAGATTTVPSAAQTIANRFPNPVPPLGKPFPPSVGASNPAQPQSPPAQVAQAPAQPQAQAAPPYQAPSDPQAVLLERTANAYAQRAAAARQKQLNLARDGDAIGAKAAGEDAAANEARANDIYQNLLKRSTPTTEIQTARAAGYSSPLEYERAKATATKQSEADVTHFSAVRNSIDAAAGAATRVEQYTQLARGILKSPDAYFGTGEGLSLAFKKVRNAINPSDVSSLPQEAYRKVVASSVLAQTERLKDAMADLGPGGAGRIFSSQIDLMQQAAGNPDNTVPALRLLTEVADRGAKFSKQIATMARSYKDGHLDAGFMQKLDDYAANHPMFSEAEMNDLRLVAPAEAPKLNSAAEAEAWKQRMGVQSGDPIKLPSGRIVPAP